MREIILLAALVATTVICSTVVGDDKSKAEPGLTTTPPDGQRFVMCERGCMVAYTAKIPGTDVTFEMLPIPAGKFRMGSPELEHGRHENESPRVEIDVEPFWMGKCEVTWGEFMAYYKTYDFFREFEFKKIRPVTIDVEIDAVTVPTIIYDPQTRYQIKDKEKLANYPAVTMTQYSAKQYTKWLSKLTEQYYRLPTEAEWEYACRADSTTTFSYGDNWQDIDDYAWHTNNALDGITQPVAKKKPNPWGLYDMHGNAGEWVLGQFTNYRELKKLVDGGKPALVVPTVEYPRIIRGGSANEEPSQCRSASRRASSIDLLDVDPSLPQSPWWLATDSSEMQIGFRIIRPLNPPKGKDRNKFWDADVPSLRKAVSDLRGEGRVGIGIVDPDLPAIIKEYSKKSKRKR